MTNFTIKIKTYSNGIRLYSPQLFNNGDWYFITKDRKYPFPFTENDYNSVFKDYSYTTLEEAERTIDMYLYNNNICSNEESYIYNPAEHKSTRKF